MGYQDTTVGFVKVKFSGVNFQMEISDEATTMKIIKEQLFINILGIEFPFQSPTSCFMISTLVLLLITPFS